MKLGLLADIHEHTEQLRQAITVLHRHGADRFVVLGDVFGTGKRMDETVHLLKQVQAVSSDIYFSRLATTRIPDHTLPGIMS